MANYERTKKINGGFTMNQNLLTVDELAESLNVKKSWVYSKSRETGPDAMPMIKVGKYCRFVLDDVLDWLKSQNDVD
jgi:excisionase family DNA binding protein